MNFAAGMMAMADFFGLTGNFFRRPFPEMHIDRGEAWIELGLRVPDWPEITFRYSHEFRDGQKDSTIWGDTTLTGLPVRPGKLRPRFEILMRRATSSRSNCRRHSVTPTSFWECVTNTRRR